MFRRKRKLVDFSSEVATHIEIETVHLQEQGLSSFGNLMQAE